jgi:hypothetical protein
MSLMMLLVSRMTWCIEGFVIWSVLVLGWAKDHTNTCKYSNDSPIFDCLNERFMPCHEEI